MEDLSVTKHGFALLPIPYETHMFCELFYVYKNEIFILKLHSILHEGEKNIPFIIFLEARYPLGETAE